MSKRISQSHYDEVVLENIQTFDMTSEEAIVDANEQFKAQVSFSFRPFIKGTLSKYKSIYWLITMVHNFINYYTF